MIWYMDVDGLFKITWVLWIMWDHGGVIWVMYCCMGLPGRM